MGLDRRRFAIYVGDANEGYQNRFICGFLKQAFGDNTDVCVFSMYRKYQDTEVREQADANIFQLANPDLFDAIIILKDSIQTAGVAEVIEEKLHGSYKKPVVVIERESAYYPSICTDGYALMVATVNHMIEVHGYKDIAFLTGKRWHKHAQMRMKAYREAMQAHGLPVKEKRIYFGDFWYTSGEQCVIEMLESGDPLPEAIICANDAMAIGLCDALTKRGYRVPEDIAVAGYDSTDEGADSPKALTSALVPAFECGEYAAKYVDALIKGEKMQPFSIEPKLFIGETCGCELPAALVKRGCRPKWSTDVSEEGFLSVNNTMSEDLLAQNELSDYLQAVYSYAYQLRADTFQLMINSPWLQMASRPDLHCMNKGYSPKVLHAMRYNREGQDSFVGTDRMFDTASMLPDLSEPSEKPRAFFFTPVFCEAECFGYAVVGYGDSVRTYDEIYRMWVNTVARGFESLRKTVALRQLLVRYGAGKGLRANAEVGAIEKLGPEEKKTLELVDRILDENLLTYHFQPIVKATDGEIYSYEALMRSGTEEVVSPLTIIKYANMLGRLPDVERATFMNVFKIIDEGKSRPEGKKIFINSIPGVKMANDDTSRIEILLEKNSDTTVVEFTEESQLEDEDLDRIQNFFGRLKLETALDDYGTGYSNINNLLRYMPNYVKIDRSLLSNIQDDVQKQHFVREIVGFCHDNRIMALAEGVETTEELRTVINLGVDLIQGYYTGRPAPMMIPRIDDRVKEEIIAFRNEREAGVIKRVYEAGKTNRIFLNTLMKDGCTEIMIGGENMVYRDISIIGMVNVESNIRIHIKSGYEGQIMLENVSLIGAPDRPCIDLESGADVTLVFHGDNKFKQGGIRVPEGATLITEGEGNLRILLQEGFFYGIGNDIHHRNGHIVFHQDGRIKIDANGKVGIGIGSGLGGKIEIQKGQYHIECNSESGVGIGAFTGPVRLSICDCWLESNMTVTKGVCIGCLEGGADIFIERATVRCYGGATEFVGIGTLSGGEAKIHIAHATSEIETRADFSTAVGALEGDSWVHMEFLSVRYDIAGKRALVFGGYGRIVGVELFNADTKIDVHNGLETEATMSGGFVRILNGRRRIYVNDSEVDIPIAFENDI